MSFHVNLFLLRAGQVLHEKCYLPRQTGLGLLLHLSTGQMGTFLPSVLPQQLAGRAQEASKLLSLVARRLFVRDLVWCLAQHSLNDDWGPEAEPQ